MKYTHKYHALFPLNICVKQWKVNFKSYVKFFLFAIGFIEIGRKKTSDELKPE
jgi:hypothetical protein